MVLNDTLTVRVRSSLVPHIPPFGVLTFLLLILTSLHYILGGFTVTVAIPLFCTEQRPDAKKQDFKEPILDLFYANFDRNKNEVFILYWRLVH